MIKEKIFLGYPINFKNKFEIYPPKIEDIVKEEDFSKYKTILTFSQEEIEDLLIKDFKDKKFPTPFEFLLGNSYNDKYYETISKKAFQFFIKQPITFLYEKKLILVGDLEKVLTEINSSQELIYITEEDFFDFQNIIRLVTGGKKVEKVDPNENERVRKMKAKSRYREKVKAKQAEKNGNTLHHIMESICCMQIGITPLNIGDLSYAAALDLVNTYQSKEKYETDIKFIAAGADSKKIKPKYWI